MAKIDVRSYNHGVKDALRMFHSHINSIEHSIGFANSQKARDHLPILHTLFNNVKTLIK